MFGYGFSQSRRSTDTKGDIRRIEDADVVVSTESQLTALCVRKQNIYTEQRVFPYVEASDLRMDLLPPSERWPRENEPDTLGTA